MREMKIEIETKSAVLLGSGEGRGSLVDADIIFDDYGLPYFPARRLKGLLRESALEIVEMLTLCGAGSLLPKVSVETVFGTGSNEAVVKFYDLKILDYATVSAWLRWAFDKYSDLFSAEMVLQTMTEIRYQTAIDRQGLARENSLRSSRVLCSPQTFTGQVYLESSCNEAIPLLALACANLKHVGSQRNRGLGKVRACLWEGEVNLTSQEIECLQGGGQGNV